MQADPMDATWGNVQSFIQLAIALNSAFAAFGSYAGNDVPKEKARLARIMRAVKNGATLPDMGPNAIGGEAEIILLEGKCDDLLFQYNDFVTGMYRIICVIAAGLGIALLLYSSVVPNEQIGGIAILVMCVFYIPFYLGLLRVAKLSWDIYIQVSLKSRHIEEHIRKQFPRRGAV